MIITKLWYPKHNSCHRFEDTFVENTKSIFWQSVFFSKSESKIKNLKSSYGIGCLCFIFGILLMIHNWNMISNSSTRLRVSSLELFWICFLNLSEFCVCVTFPRLSIYCLSPEQYLFYCFSRGVTLYKRFITCFKQKGKEKT